MPIARGGMAQVWAARLRGSRGFTKLVAVKVILPGGMDNTRLEQMFLEEASLAALIHHPNVVETLELGEHEGTLYLVMEWVEGESLRYVQNRARRARRPSADRGGQPHGAGLRGPARSARAVRRGRKAPRARSPRHFPQNVLDHVHGGREDRRLRHRQGDGPRIVVDRSGEIKGKVAYMSPEQLRAARSIAGATSSRSASCSSCSPTGTHPFKGTNPGETVRRIVLAMTSSRDRPSSSRTIPRSSRQSC